MRIQCPECSQRFDVTEDFLGKTVECGSCDNRFKVTTSEVVADKKKFYPGEKRDSHLERFGRTASEGLGNVGFTQAHYRPDVNAERIGPPRPRRVLAQISGVVLMLLVVVIFLLAGGSEGTMRDMETLNRFVLCGFTALLGGMLVIYGSAHNRKLGFMLTFLLGGVLLILPVFFPGNPVSESSEEIVISTGGGNGEGLENTREVDDYLFEIGYEPISNALAKHPKESVVGIYLRNVSETVQGKIAVYLYSATDKASRETSYKRGDDGEDGLILLIEQTKTIDEIAALCSKFGRIEKIDKELRLIDVMVENSKINSLDKYKVLDPNSLDFEAQNLRALKSFDPVEQMNAVKRLAGSKPRMLRDDISKQLTSMLPTSKPELQLEIINALKTWALPESEAGPVVLDTVKQLHTKGMVNKTCMDFLIAHKVDGCAPILMDLWTKNPIGWSQNMLQLGAGAEMLLLPAMKDMDVARIVAASDILAKVGTKTSVEHLQQLMAEKDEQSQKSMQAAIDEIKKRS